MGESVEFKYFGYVLNIIRDSHILFKLSSGFPRWSLPSVHEVNSVYYVDSSCFFITIIDITVKSSCFPGSRNYRQSSKSYKVQKGQTRWTSSCCIYLRNKQMILQVYWLKVDWLLCYLVEILEVIVTYRQYTLVL